MKSNNNETENIINSTHEVKEELHEIKNENDKKTQCSFCGQKFRFLKALQKHEARHQGEGGFICRTCGLHFTSSDAREKHRDKEHKVLRCKICNIRFDSDSEYLHHINSLHDGRDKELSMCSTCGKQFKTKGELTHHVSSKCGTIKKYQCSVCFQTLMTAGSLHNHMLRHTGQRSFMCRFCAKTFLTAGQLTVHERIHTQEKAFVCEICNKGFCHRQSLITHSTLHTGIKPYQCEGCGNSFSCVGNLLKHRKTHAESCGKIPLTTHRVQHPSTKLKVQVNTPATSKLRTLEKKKKIEQQVNSKSWQQDTNSDNSLYSDPVSKKMILQDSGHNYIIPDLNLSESKIDNPENDNNLSFVKEENWTPPINFQTTEQIFTNLEPCQNKLRFLDMVDIPNENIDSIKNEDSKESDEDWTNDDAEDHCNNDDFESSDDSIDLCTRKLKLDKQKRELNMKDKNKTKVKNRRKSSVDREKLQRFIAERGFDEEKGLNCKYCGNHYSVPLWLMKHEQKHEKSMSEGDFKSAFKCSCCGKFFETKDDCVNHQQIDHANELTCKNCDRFFANPDSLKAHTNVYHKGVPRKKYVYVCEKCGKIFKQKALLLIHEQNNCSDGPLFQCEICQKSFTSKHVQKSHMRVHLPEKSLLCKFCGKSFHWKGQLKIHERSHTGERPFKCEFCPKAFAYRESLITHNSLHTGIKPHLCEACGSRFSCIGNLLKHRRTHATTCGVVSQVKTEVLVS